LKVYQCATVYCRATGEAGSINNAHLPTCNTWGLGHSPQAQYTISAI